ncbi:MAG: hypothetical protein ACYCW6_31560, partial [Candidatus Xenobia bacterium]
MRLWFVLVLLLGAAAFPAAQAGGVLIGFCSAQGCHTIWLTPRLVLDLPGLVVPGPHGFRRIAVKPPVTFVSAVYWSDGAHVYRGNRPLGIDQVLGAVA